jgi:23S rRNA (guanosine2251-2'-O)-methyltransferase
MNPKEKDNSTPRFISGRNPVREQLEREDSRAEKLFLQKGATGKLMGLQKLAHDVGVPVQFVPTGKLNTLVPGVNHQGAVLAISSIEYQDVDDMLAAIAPTMDEVIRKRPIVVVLDHIQDPHNLGAIIRSCVAAGAEGVIIPDRGAAPVTAATIKTSAGTVSEIPIARVGNLSQLIDQLKERGYWIVGAEGSGETSMLEMDWDRPLGIVIGSEEKGMGRVVRGACDYLVHIPMRGKAESLNASVAAGILLFQASLGRPE